MNRDKQIEEMAEEISEVTEASVLITDRYGNVYGTRRVGVSDPKQIAEHLISKGYRLASEVAREMCGMLREDLRGFVDADYLERLLTIYEKKYTEGEE